jgi:hypothetical protein
MEINSTATVEIDSSLRDCNPFTKPPFVTAEAVWQKGFTDIARFNAHASDAVFQALSDINNSLYSSASILITAQDGTGKSHIISRIRHRLQEGGDGFFILANKFSDLNQIKPGFQRLLADSLFQIGFGEVKQWQKLATDMGNEVLKSINSNSRKIAPSELVNKFNKAVNKSVWVDKISQEFCKCKHIEDPDVVRGIFWTLSEQEAAYASNWLGGKELSQYKANSLGLPTQNQSFETTLQILSLIGEYNSLVICFDELDVADFNEVGFRKAQVVVNLVKELVDNIKHGVILSVMMPGIWQNEVASKLPASVTAKMSTAGEPIGLHYIDENTIVDLVSLFLKDYYDSRQLHPPHYLYPFDEGKLRNLHREKYTVRELLKWCRKNCVPEEGPEPGPVPSSNVEEAFKIEMTENIANLLDDSNIIAETLIWNFQGIVNKSIDGILVREIETKFGKKKDKYVNFKIVGVENDCQIVIGVAVLQYDSGKALGAGLKKLLDLDRKLNLTRGCLIRSEEKGVSKYLRDNYLQPLVANGGEFVVLKSEEIKPLIALRSVHLKRDSDYQLTKEEIDLFIRDKGMFYQLGEFNPLIKEILSDPSCQIPDNLPEEPEDMDNSLNIPDGSDSIEDLLN